MLTKWIVFLTLTLSVFSSAKAPAQTVSNGEQVLPFAASLTLSPAYAATSVTLTGNVTAINLPTGRFGGQAFHLTICQNGSGGYTVPSSWSNTTGVTAVNGTGCTRFHLVWDDPWGVWISSPDGQSATGATGAMGPAGATGPAGPAGTPNTASLPLTISSGNLAISGFGASGAAHATGVVPDPGATAGATRYLREDATWNQVTAIGISGFTTPTAAGTATLTQTIASGTASLGTAAIASGACAVAVTATAAGVTATDILQTTFNADPTSTTGYAASVNGMLTILPYPAGGSVNFRVCNNTASSITPGAVTLNWKVVR